MTNPGNGHTYEDGLREGRLKGIEETVQHHSERLTSAERRLTSQERISYSLLGAIMLIELLPTLASLGGNG